MRVRLYAPDDAPRWDAWCTEAYGATFLHSRRFLSYHGDRFDDRSLIVEDPQGAWLGLLPAARHPNDSSVVVSHPGITYGGFLHHGALRGEAMLRAFELACAHYVASGARTLKYKPVPHIYQRAPAQDDLYALFRLGAQRVRCDLSSCIALDHPLPMNERRRRALKKAQRAGLVIDSGVHNAAEFWPVLADTLWRRHGLRPVHSLDEMLLLAERFPEQIRVCVARREKAVLAGIVLFICGALVHTQYVAASEEGQALSALDLLIHTEISHARDNHARFFDFGNSNEEQGRVLNQGLHRFKSEFGAGGVVHEFYDIELAR